MVVNEVNEKELLAVLIDKYADLQRILTSDNYKEEAEYQLQLVKAKLESMGIVTSDLDKRHTSKS